MRPTHPLVSFLCLAIVFAIAGCSHKEHPDDNTIRLGYTPSDLTLNERGYAFEALRAYLEREIGMPVELVRTGSYEPAIVAMQLGQIDIMNFGSQAYLIAENLAGAEAFAVRGQANGMPLDYSSIIIVPSDSPIHTIGDLKTNAGDCSMLFTDNASTSGYLVAKAFLSELGLDAETSFSDTQFTGSHALSILKLVNNEADVACVNGITYQWLVEQNKIDPRAIRKLWQSRPIPRGPVAYRSSLPEPVKQRIREAYYEMPQRSPSTLSLLAAIHPDETFVYIPCPENSLDWLREVRDKKTTTPLRTE